MASVAQGTLQGVNYNPVRGGNSVGKTLDVFHAFGIIAFAFRGHNLILEIQVCDVKIMFLLISTYLIGG
jgi:hypothetical protein